MGLASPAPRFCRRPRGSVVEDVDKHTRTSAGHFSSEITAQTSYLSPNSSKELKAVHNPAYSKETIAGKLLSAIEDNQKLEQASLAINSASK